MILDGKKLASAIQAQVATECAALPYAPKLAAILVGSDPASLLYVSLKERACADAGIVFEKRELAAPTTQAELHAVIDRLAARDDVDAILLQFPLPAGLDADAAVRRIPPEKDVDGFHPENLRLLLSGTPTIVPPTIVGIIELLRSTGVFLRDKTSVIVAKPDSVFITPLATMLSREGLRCGNIAPDAADLARRLRGVDVVVTLAGIPGLIRGHMLKPGGIVIDMATVRTTDGKVVGDVDRASAEPIAGWLSPVPGGVGPMTVAMLIKNVVTLARKRRGVHRA